jgi:hypothetical protein
MKGVIFRNDDGLLDDCYLKQHQGHEVRFSKRINSHWTPTHRPTNTCCLLLPGLTLVHTKRQGFICGCATVLPCWIHSQRCERRCTASYSLKTYFISLGCVAITVLIGFCSLISRHKCFSIFPFFEDLLEQLILHH